MRDLAPMASLPADPWVPHDGRPPPTALDIYRGVARLLSAHRMAPVAEVSLANGRHAYAVSSG